MEIPSLENTLETKRQIIILKDMKKLIEQIRKISGVKTVESAGENMAVVVFEKQKKLILTSDDGVPLYEGQEVYLVPFKQPVWKGHNLLCIYPDTIAPLEDGEYWCPRYKRFSTEQAAKDWIASQKPESLNPKELVDGNIYVSHSPLFEFRIIRIKSCNDTGRMRLYSQMRIQNENEDYWGSTDGFIHGFLRHATDEEKKRLIKAEVEHGYFHELR